MIPMPTARPIGPPAPAVAGEMAVLTSPGFAPAMDASGFAQLLEDEVETGAHDAMCTDGLAAACRAGSTEQDAAEGAPAQPTHAEMLLALLPVFPPQQATQPASTAPHQAPGQGGQAMQSAGVGGADCAAAWTTSTANDSAAGAKSAVMQVKSEAAGAPDTVQIEMPAKFGVAAPKQKTVFDSGVPFAPSGHSFLAVGPPGPPVIIPADMPIFTTPGPSPVVAQFAPLLSRLRRDGSVHELALAPATLGSVKLSWVAGSGAHATLRIVAAEPATAQLLGSLRDQIKALAQVESARTSDRPADVRIDIVTDTRTVAPERRSATEMHPAPGSSATSTESHPQRDHQHAPNPQALVRAAVIVDEQGPADDSGRAEIGSGIRLA